MNCKIICSIYKILRIHSFNSINIYPKRLKIISYIYIEFFCTQSDLHRRGNLLNHHQCAASTWMMRRQPYCARTPTTHQLQVERRQSDEANQCMGMIRRPMGKFDQDTGVTPLLFSKNILVFLMTTEYQDLGLTSHPKDGGQ